MPNTIGNREAHGDVVADGHMYAAGVAKKYPSEPLKRYGPYSLKNS